MIGTNLENNARTFSHMLTAYLDAVRSIRVRNVPNAEDVAKANEDKILQLRALLDDMAKRQDAIALDRSLSDEGKATALDKLGKEVLAKIGFLDERVNNLDMYYTRIHAELFPIPKAPTGEQALLSLLIEQEIRSYLRGLSQSELALAYAKAVQDGRDDQIRAIKQSPVPLPIDREYIERIDRQHAETTHPDQVATLEMIDDARSQMRNLVNALRSWLSAYGGLEKFMKPKTVEIRRGGKLIEDRWGEPDKSVADRPTAQQFT